MHLAGNSNFALCSSLLLDAVAGGATRFIPEDKGLLYADYVMPLPTQYNLSDSQSVYTNGIGNSYWSSSYIYGDDDHEYLLLSHIIIFPTVGAYRGSLLDITDPSFYTQFTTVYNASTYYRNDTGFNFEFNDFYFGAASEDRLGSINTYSTSPDLSYNLTYDLSAPVLLNGGTGTFQWEMPGIVNEWSMPAGRTTGSFEKNGTTVTVDTDKSLTWYDRQWQLVAASNWTWFELHLDSGTKLSVWFFPSGYDNSTKGFATIREKAGIHTVIPAKLTEGTRTWTSCASNRTYHLEFTIDLLDGTWLNASAIRDDSELVDSTATFANYEGFVNVVGTNSSGGQIGGYGLVEIQ